jgi:TPR repeat protein
MAIAISDRIERGANEHALPASCLTNVGCSMTASADAIADRSFAYGDPCLRNLGRVVSEPESQAKNRLERKNISVLSVGTIGFSMEPFLKNMEPMERARYYVLNKVSSGYTEALEIFSDPENVNTPVAQYFLGMIYYHGLGVPKDAEKAFRFMSISYEGKNLNASYYLGMMYLKGFGTKKIPNKAMMHLKEAANTVGDSRAELQVGLMYLRGEGLLAPDEEKAFKWVEKAALHSNVEAKFILGQMYRTGCGCDVEMASAFRHLESAAKKGHKGAQILLGNMYLKGEGVRSNKAMAEHWYNVADGKESLT